MSYGIVVRRLTEADLSLFDRGGRDPLSWQDAWLGVPGRAIDAPYPGLRRRVPVVVVVIGPGGAEPLCATRALERRDGARGWRLGGEAIGMGTERFVGVAAGDVALLAIGGERVPDVVWMAVLSAAQPMDATLVEAFSAVVPAARSSELISPDLAVDVVEQAGVGEAHPLWAWTAALAQRGGDADADDAALEVFESFAALRRRATSVGMAEE